MPFLAFAGAWEDPVGVEEACDVALAAGELGELVVADGVHRYNRYLGLHRGISG